MKLKSLKHRKPIVYISLVIYVLLSALIIIESCIPSGPSGRQSDIFATISAWIINVVNGPKIPKSIDPSSFGDVTDSSYLGQDEDGNSNIAIGTTTLVSIQVAYPSKRSYDVYNYKYELSYVSGNKDDYNVVLSSRKINELTYCIDMRVVAKEMSDDLYQIDVKVADKLTYPYKFHIVPLEEPTNYECKLEKETLKIGESSKVITKLLDEKRDDPYLRRYLDESKINRSSSNNAVATIDEYGVIHGVSQGTAVITYGKYNFDITITDENINKPAGNSINLEIEPSSSDNPSLLDYDYVFEKDENPNDYSTLIYGNFTDDTLEDQSLSWVIDDPLKAKLAPYKYDEDGYPIYHDDDNKPCVRVCGYRKNGDVNVTCISNADNSVYSTINLNVCEALPTSMTLNVKSNLESLVNEQTVVSATFNPKNVNNRNIHIESDNENITITNNDSASVTISGTKVGSAKITVTSVANPTLVQEFNISFKAKDTINDDNYDDFSSFMRKAAGHFSLFLVTAIFGMMFFYTYMDDIKKLWITVVVTLSLGVIVAAVSELIQTIVPGRSGVAMDVGIDSLGYFIGMLLTLGVILLIRLIKNKIKKKKEIASEE